MTRPPLLKAKPKAVAHSKPGDLSPDECRDGEATWPELGGMLPRSPEGVAGSSPARVCHLEAKIALLRRNLAFVKAAQRDADARTWSAYQVTRSHLVEQIETLSRIIEWHQNPAVPF